MKCIPNECKQLDGVKIVNLAEAVEFFFVCP